MPNPFYTGFQYTPTSFNAPTEPFQSWGESGTSTSGGGTAASWNQGDFTILPENGSGGSAAGNGYRVFQMPEGYSTRGDLNGVNYDTYSPDGQFLSTDQFKDMDIPWYLKGSMPALLPLAVAGGAWAGGLGGAAATGATGTLPALELASMGGLESLPMYEMGAGLTGGAGGFVGEGALSGIPSWDAALPGVGESVSGMYPGIGPTGTLPSIPPIDPSVLADGTPALGPASTYTPSLPGFPGGSGTPTPTPGGNGNGNNSGGATPGIADLLKLLTGAYDIDRADKSTDTILQWLNGQQSYIDGLYAPGSPEYNAMWDQMSRTDAAAGRNSQYGPRTVDLAGKLAQIKGDQRVKLATGVADVYSNAINRENSSHAGLSSALASMFGGSNSSADVSSMFSMLNNWLKSSGSGNTWNDTSLADFFYNGNTGTSGD